MCKWVSEYKGSRNERERVYGAATDTYMCALQSAHRPGSWAGEADGQVLARAQVQAASSELPERGKKFQLRTEFKAKDATPTFLMTKFLFCPGLKTESRLKYDVRRAHT